MQKYTITIEETISEKFEVTANNEADALEIARNKYNKGSFVLELGDIVHKQLVVEETSGDIKEWIVF